MPQFEIVSKYKDCNIDLIPKRGTKFAAGYDFVAAEDVIIEPYCDLIEKLRYEHEGYDALSLDDVSYLTKKYNCKPTLISTGVKCKLNQEQFLLLVSRSSSPLKYWLIQGNAGAIIDADYYGNESNEGEIFYQVINLSPFPIKINKGDKICQGIIMHYNKTDNDSIVRLKSREGGFGSTSI